MNYRTITPERQEVLSRAVSAIRSRPGITYRELAKAVEQPTSATSFVHSLLRTIEAQVCPLYEDDRGGIYVYEEPR